MRVCGQHEVIGLLAARPGKEIPSFQSKDPQVSFGKIWSEPSRVCYCLSPSQFMQARLLAQKKTKQGHSWRPKLHTVMMNSRQRLQLQLKTTIEDLKGAYTELVSSELAPCSISTLVHICRSLNDASAAVDSAWRDIFKPSIQPYRVKSAELRDPRVKSAAIIEDGWMAGFDPIVVNCRRMKPRS